MNGPLRLEPLNTGTFSTYCEIGEQAYREHYLHLWPEKDPSPYLKSSFTTAVLKNEVSDPATFHFIIRNKQEGIGIAKLVRNKGFKEFPDTNSILLEKIYILQSCTGKGCGTQVLEQLETYAKGLGMRYLWLATMKKGEALKFYQKLGYSIKGEQILPFENARPEEKGMYILVKEIFNAVP